MHDGRILEYFVSPGGEIRFIHSDEAAALTADLPGGRSGRRASHIELAADGSGWQADCGPVGGPVFGPFRLDDRAAAVRAEIAWLRGRLDGGEL